MKDRENLTKPETETKTGPETKMKVIPMPNFDKNKYNAAVENFKAVLGKKYPKMDMNTLSISPVMIETDETPNDKYILFASFMVDKVNKTAYNYE